MPAPLMHPKERFVPAELPADTGAEINQRVLDEVALTRAEYDRIVKLFGRAPNHLELGLFGAMWSEHCGYKNSRPLLKRFPTTGPRVLLKAGEENAGAVDIGDGLAVVMKIESHNHPSAVEPYQGAATGVGGIVRDIFTMGARPIALLDSLRFGPLSEPRNRYLFAGIVGGIGGYGNCLGIPTVGGEIYFDASYSGNPLVNAMCVGLIEADRLVPARASGIGNPVLLVGASTGRDGIHGATFASVELDEASEERRPAVQVGNPFTEKLLMEACLQLRDTGWIVGMQDLGAAGLTSSSVESAHKGGAGIEMDVLRAPRREAGMTPYDVMLSESQERMLVIAHADHQEDIRTLFDRWGLHSEVVGHVIAEPVIRVREGERLAAEVPTALLTDEVPSYMRDGVPPPELERLWRFDARTLAGRLPAPGDALLHLLASSDLCSREDVYRTYDTMVGANTLIGPGSDAAVLRVRDASDQDTGKAIALCTDGNGRLTYLDPYNGGALAVAEAARNVVCSGARPLALTNCLNFGNPEKPQAYYQLAQAIDGMAEAARVLETPVISGNVSLYNESFGQSIYPTPVVGMLGLLEGGQPIPSAFQAEGDVVALLGETTADPAALGGSTYLAALHRTVAGRPPRLDLSRERAVQRLTLHVSQRGLLRSAHDCSDGGLGVALAECAIWSGLGLRGEVPPVPSSDRLAAIAWLFGEQPSRIVVTVAPDRWDELTRLARAAGVSCARLGVVGGERIRLGGLLDVGVSEAHNAWRGGLAALHAALAEPKPDVPQQPQLDAAASTSSATDLRAQLVDKLRTGGVLTDSAVERALRAVPRHLFLPGSMLEDAYADTAVPTRFADGVAISSASQPAIVAAMLQQLQAEPGMCVLEIGAGTGYNAALLAELVGPSGSVTSLDIDAETVDEARAHLEAANYTNIHVVATDGAFGWPSDAPYDRIILTVGAWDIAPAWLDQLAEGGLLVLPLWLGGGDASVTLRKRDGALYSESVLPCGFMRLRGAEAGPERWLSVASNRKLFVERADEIGPRVAELLGRRPRRRLWRTQAIPMQPFMQRLGLRGHHVVALHTDNAKARQGRLRMRLGVYAEGEDGPSLALIGSLPLLLVFGGSTAQHIIEEEAAHWGASPDRPIEQAQIVARPLEAAAGMPVPAGAFRITRRHFAYDITL
jgi:phosphoribosylformylglycinamidine synthase